MKWSEAIAKAERRGGEALHHIDFHITFSCYGKPAQAWKAAYHLAQRAELIAGNSVTWRTDQDELLIDEPEEKEDPEAETLWLARQELEAARVKVQKLLEALG